MKIACYALAYNEERILPHFIEHYKEFCDKIVIYDNMSTDDTKQLSLDLGCDVVSWEAPGGGLSDKAYIDIKSNCYKETREDFDWIIIADSDEFFTHREGVSAFVETLERYKEEGITLPKIQGYNMVGDATPETLNEVTKGVPDVSYSKRCLFDSKLDMSWDWGCHPQHSQSILDKTAGVVESKDTDIVLLHYKFISLDYVLDRHKLFSSRLSEFNKKLGLGIHYTYEEDKIREEYLSLLDRAKKVL